jgi:hypothetical protein
MHLFHGIGARSPKENSRMPVGGPRGGDEGSMSPGRGGLLAGLLEALTARGPR